MRKFSLSTLAYFWTVGLGLGVEVLTNGRISIVMFVAASALWWAVRAYFEAAE